MLPTRTTRTAGLTSRTVAAALFAVTAVLPSVALANANDQLDNAVEGGAGGGLVFGGTLAGDGSSVGNGASIVPNSGMLDSPFYYSPTNTRYYGMTYRPGSNIPFSFGLGIGSGGSEWHGNTQVVVSQVDNSRAAGAALGALSGGATSTGFSVTSSTIVDGGGERGAGALTARGDLVFDGVTLRVTHTYEVAAGTNFVKATTQIQTTGGTASNVRFWIGTSDDWIGTTDGPTSSLGLVTGTGAAAAFAPKCDGPTNAVLVESDAEFLLLYSPDTTNAQAVLSAVINVFDSSVNVDDDFYEEVEYQGEEFEANLSIIDQNPLDSIYRSEENDGAHALAINFGDVGTDAVSREWYYQAAVLPEAPFAACPTPQQQIFRRLTPASTPYVSRLALVCAPDPVVAGGTVTCDVTGGDPGIDILWEADLGGVFATAGVTLDDLGNGRFSFIAPPGSTGRSVAVRLVAWNVDDEVAVSGEAVPTRLPAGEGPAGPAPALLVAGLMLVAGLGLARLRSVTSRP